MRRLLLAAFAAVTALSVAADRSSAAMIIFTGVVDEVDAQFTPVPFAVGDSFSATFTFSYHPDPSRPGGGGGRVTAYLFNVGDLTLGGTIEPGAGVSVHFNTNPQNGTVFYQLPQFQDVLPPFGVLSAIDLNEPTPTGVVPPLDQFNTNTFDLQLVKLVPPGGGEQPQDTATGHLTSFPVLTGLTVPDQESTIGLLFLALTVLLSATRLGSLRLA